MNAPVKLSHPAFERSALAQKLEREIEGEVLFDAFSRGRYSTDASIYQIEPLGVVMPKTEHDARVALQIAEEERVPILPRGAGTSQCGQTVGAALVIDNSRHLNKLIEFDRERRTASVQPGLVLDSLNAALKPHGLWYPVDVSTSAQATLGGMAGNNSCGSRSIRYGNMVHNVLGIEAWLPGGAELNFGEAGADGVAPDAPQALRALAGRIHDIARREAGEIAARWPKLLRRVGGYNLDMVQPTGSHNLAHLLVGSEGTLAYFKRLQLKLSPIPRHKVLGVVHFPTFYRAMQCTREIVELDPDAVELVDRTMIDLARGNPAFRTTVERFLRGEPEAVLLTEFAGDERDAQLRKLARLVELMGELGLPGSVVEITDDRLQREVWEVRKAGLNIMMSMKGDGKPVSFIEDCAVPLEHLAEYTERLTRVFEKHGTRGTWYAHASVGTLHVRPVLDMRRDGAAKMRAIAEEACAMVREYKGSYSGEHGDGLVRSEWIEPIYGAKLTRAFEDIKRLFDPQGLMNPGKIVRPSKMDDRSLFRFAPGYATPPLPTALDWSEHETDAAARGQGFAKAVEMCNNNGHCRKFDAGVMCPSFRVTGEERHLTRGRANSLRLALSGQLGPDALASEAMFQTFDLCVSCKGCRRECPTGVDMAKMKIEFLHHYRKRHAPTPKERLIAYLPRWAPYAARLPWLANLRDTVPGLKPLTESLLGLSAQRSLPRWRSDPFLKFPPGPPSSKGGKDVVLLVDTFNNYFEPDNARAAHAVLQAAGYRVHLPQAAGGGRPLCCGRTFLSQGLTDEARFEAKRTLAALTPFVERGIAVVGLEPSCLLGLRDEFVSLLPGAKSAALARQAFLFEEFVAREHAAGRLQLALKPLPQAKVLLHGHCHQKAFGAMPDVVRALGLVPGLAVETVESSCCGMAGSFGYDAAHFEVSMRMGEASLLPKVRAAAADTLVVADGVSCRHQIHDGAGREALHVARVLARALS